MKPSTITANPTDRMFRAFSDRTRLRMLYLLRAGESCVGDIVQILGIEQPKVSRHLAYLRRARLVAVRKAGLWSYYRLASAGDPFHAKLLECLACCFAEVPEIRADEARAVKVRRSGGCCPDDIPEPDKSRRKAATKPHAACCGEE
jgi:ArsR family transcriptional regulator